VTRPEAERGDPNADPLSGTMQCVSLRGTDSHRGASALPPLVADAVALCERLEFPHACRLEQGRLLHALASGAVNSIGETGTGCGVGLAWLCSAAGPDVRLVSVERDPVRAALSAALFANHLNVTVVSGDWTLLEPYGPFDLLVLDGGGNGKGGPAADPGTFLRPGGTVVVDDFTPCDEWPPRHDGRIDEARLHWLDHPALRSVEVRIAPDLVTVLGVRR
jgi:predicted O-methyltransferase YrrM